MGFRPDYVNYNGKQFRIISDQVGTPKMIVDSSNGQVVESFNYDEFGVSLDGKTSAIIPFGFAGGLSDSDTGLVRFGARDYSPIVGRWTNKDPSGFSGRMSNLYGYASFDPVNFIDYNGRDPLEAVVAGAIAGVIIGGISSGVTTWMQNGSFGEIMKSAANGAVGGAVGGAMFALAAEGNVLAGIGSVMAGVTSSLLYGVGDLGNASKDFFKGLVYVNNSKNREQQLLDCADGKQ
ncbi:RHS repeat domain-containing protein [Bdellovibrio svalbardensis]|uniref:RHS repeat-associated core domain-containing protein n=1 Tax=Bdellovibrio svalbardensis TaxID=2972972 RepID=A0ABT6DIV6_9BACT|nr:RHS repeat-associated core domain-containing protein [Bdellovibrio svalbardensis]MDG0816437.1 RHS repeat-associated core domain-containing protein [Bdellovibrio svalbardensis]